MFDAGEEWHLGKLGDLIGEVSERIDPSQATVEHGKYVGLEHIGQRTGRLSGCGRATDVVSQKSVFHPGDILYGKLRPNLCKVARPQFGGVCSTDIIVFRAKDGADADFAFQLLQSDPLVEYAVATAAGTKMPRTHARSILSFEAALPPLGEQRRIAEVLRSLDDAISATEQVEMHLRAASAGTIEEIVSRGLAGGGTQATEIGDVPIGWEVVRLSDLLKIKHGFAFSSDFFRREKGDAILLTPGNFSTNKTLYFGPNTKFYDGPIPDGYVLENGDLLVVMTDLTQDMAILGNA
jgi:type I restriction enzyme S subunit